MAWAWHGHGIQGMAPSAPIERGAARRGATSLNFAAKSIAPRAKKDRPTQLENLVPSAWQFLHTSYVWYSLGFQQELLL